MISKMISAFVKGWQGYTSRGQCNRQATELRNDLSEHQIDHMVEDSFPASDPPSTY